ncbi:MAG: SagB/ThcOx family dehydrogenase [Roseitalea sp.]|nr:SagB/ThcOx family dehydrogenase [Roseitalea sp.]MBO6950433.1 SagB/ThcOx family dehydrogenase [Rhizobiaceae bacterium]MBO6591578.1 SagB/ThcOx family dehydrogenase [Roseitalea sp.]MBO6599433.1 SagB/ThcOx family dehydrogenase [Roseitalea sp.]MBO6612078.1 SagB/ThcOx family dehydrogenase [Roseitalea sp.]
MRRRDPSRRRSAARREGTRALRASRSVVLSWDEGEMLACNFLTRQVTACSVDLVEFLSHLQDWQRVDEIIAAFQGVTADALDALVHATLLIERDSEEARREEEYLSSWNWGVPAAMLHFCLQDADFLPLEAAEQLQEAKSAEVRSPGLHLPNEGRFHPVISLKDDVQKNSALTAVMERRRTVRECDATAYVGQGSIADCLYAGLGITGWTSNCVGKLPLGMTPSGGARNPFEAYLFVKRVEGLAPGIYHYSALEHSIGRVGETECELSDLVAGQDWAETMSCAIVLCASLERTMWKYPDANAYRVVMIEAGHIGQNIMLAATAAGLTACPTAALSHSRIRDAIGLERLTDTPVYALTIGVPAKDARLAA